MSQQGQQGQYGTGSYYGAHHINPQPQAQPPYQTPQRPTYCCLLSTLVKAIIAACVTLLALVLVLWLVFEPDKIRVTVESASLTAFTLSTNPSTLSYNLTAGVSIRNPNEKVGVYYDWLKADAYFDGYPFSWTALPEFYQGHKNTTVVYLAFEGRTGFEAGGDSGVAGDFKKQNDTSFFLVDVWLYARVRYKFGSVLTTGRRTARSRCGLGIPLAKNNGSSQTNNRFSRADCDVVDF